MTKDELVKELRNIIKGVKPYLEMEISFGNREILRLEKVPPKKPARPPGLSSQKSIDFVTLPDDLEELKNVTERCLKCTQLCRGRRHVVFGSGNPDARLVFVGEAPGEEEDRQGLPFVGRAGQLLTKMIEGMNLTRDEVYIANVLKCQPPGNRTPLPSEIVQCLPFLKKQLEIIHPEVIIALGAIAARALLQSEVPLAQMRGKVFTYDEAKLLVTYHPAYLLRSPNEKPKVWADLKKAKQLLESSGGSKK